MFFNVCTLFFAVLAWGIPLRAITPKHRNRGFYYVIGSLGACLSAILVQMLRVVLGLYFGGEILSAEEFSLMTTGLAVVIVGTAMFLLMSIYIKNKK
ncbi:MAG: hypothetical protein R3Y63_08620 [Eubacteriales bacterium]